MSMFYNNNKGAIVGFFAYTNGASAKVRGGVCKDWNARYERYTHGDGGRVRGLRGPNVRNTMLIFSRPRDLLRIVLIFRP